jgi:hypothetical protein
MLAKKHNKSNSGDEYTHTVVNSKTARVIVMGGLVVSFSVIMLGETLKGAKKIITKPFFRKRNENVGCSSDLY